MIKMFCMICGKESEQPMCPVCMSYKIVQGKVSNRKLTVKNNSKLMTLPVRSIDSEITKVSVIEVMKE